MNEPRKLWIEGPAGRLEAMLRVGPSSRASAVLAHPHPLYGGTLHNPVVFHADRDLVRAGFTTLRFNFRGVGSSEGVHDEGRGEVEDVAAAASWLRGLSSGSPLLLVGYSFGAWCAIRHAGTDPAIAAVVAIGLPVRSYAFEEPIAKLAKPLAIVQGSDDELGSPDDVRALVERTHARASLRVVSGATHLFPRRTAEAGAAVLEAVQWCLAQDA